MGFLLSLFLAFYIGACAPKTPTFHRSHRTDGQAPAEFKTLRSDIHSRLKRLEKTLENGLESRDAILEEVKTLKSRYRALSQSFPPKGGKELLQQYCEAMLGILSDFEEQARRTYKEAQGNALARLKKMDRELSDEFVPGPFERVSKFFKKNRSSLK